jgi:hypothetical protein
MPIAWPSDIDGRRARQKRVVGVDVDDELQLAGRHALHDPVLKAVGLDQLGFGPAREARLPVERGDGTRPLRLVAEMRDVPSDRPMLLVGELLVVVT